MNARKQEKARKMENLKREKRREEDKNERGKGEGKIRSKNCNMYVLVEKIQKFPIANVHVHMYPLTLHQS